MLFRSTGLTATAVAVLTLSLPMVAAHAAQTSVRVHVLSPTAGALVTGTAVPLLSDGGATTSWTPAQVTFQIDGTTVGTATRTVDGYALSWDSTTVASGGHQVTATATGVKGRSYRSPAVSFSVTNTGVVPTTTTTSTPSTTSTTVAAPVTTTTTTAPAVSSVPLGVAGSWRLLFADEFSGSAVDTSKWAFTSSAEADNGQGNKGNQQLEWNQAANCSVGNGALTITAKPDSITSPSGVHYDWSSCLITSSPSYAFQYGYIEERAKFPAQAGFWPGFWTWQVPGLNQWVETDAYEYYSDNPSRLYLTQHSGSGGQCVVNPGFDPSGGFHTYGVDVEPTGTTWYLDGKAVCSVAGTAGGMSNIITNMFVYSQLPPAPGTVAQKQVDYIRAWQH